MRSIGFDVSGEVPGEVEVIGVLAAGGILPPPFDPALAKRHDFSAKRAQALVQLGPGGTEHVLVGVGESPGEGGEGIRCGAGCLAREMGDAARVALDLRALGSGEAVAQAAVEGLVLGAYSFDTYKAPPPDVRPPLSVTVVSDEPATARSGVARGEVIAAAVVLARDLVNEPPEEMTPSRMASVARQLGEREGLDIRIWDERDIGREGLGGLEGVARGSDEPARLIRVEYRPEGVADEVPTLAIVGKGITFDSGGLSIKTAEGMTTMKTDMSGAAAVLATMSALRRLDVAARVVGWVPATENMPGPGAIKPGDVLRIRNGKTIEVLNTDAEGRLVLADALSLAAEDQPDAIVDLATLTGACVVALGREIAGLMGNEDALMGRVEEAAQRAGEAVWRLPLPARYRRHIDSDVADMKNIGAPGQAGTIAAALLLREFVGSVPWAHLDIAGPARSEADDGYLRKGATGFGVRSLVELAASFGRDP